MLDYLSAIRLLDYSELKTENSTFPGHKSLLNINGSDVSSYMSQCCGFGKSR